MVILIELCGVDGVGKTLLVEGLSRMYEGDDSLLLTNEPFNRELVSKYLGMDADIAAYAFAMDRYNHIAEIERMIREDSRIKVVITDRYYHCSFAYQAVDGVPIWWNAQIQPRNLIIPNLSVLLTCSPEVACVRSKEPDVERARAIQNVYRSVFRYPVPSPVVEIDTTCKSPIDVLHEFNTLFCDFLEVQRE